MNLNQIICGDWVEIAETLPGKSLHCIITSPPYWGQRNYGVEGQLGLEKTPEEHIEKLVAGFGVLREKLRDDGVMFVNYGDKYAGGGNNRGNNSPLSAKQASNKGATGQVGDCYKVRGVANGNLIGLAWRLALALQADGWILRSDTIWAKAVSFCDVYSGSTMPESINGWRWEKCRVKVSGGNRGKEKQRKGSNPIKPQQDHNGKDFQPSAKWITCPGCAKCKPNGGYVLRKGSWRSTRAHEYLFQFVKTNNYYCDMEAVREPVSENTHGRGTKLSRPIESAGIGHKDFTRYCLEKNNPSGRNLRDVWLINPQAYPDAHYATFPEKLVEPCIKVATSQKGCCPECGAQWARVVDKEQVKRYRRADRTDRHKQGDGVNSCGNTVAGVRTTTIGWRATCGCGLEETVPAIVYDPFMGSGTVAAVAAKLNRNYLGSELNPDYITEQARYRVDEAETGLTKKEQHAGQRGLFG